MQDSDSVNLDESKIENSSDPLKNIPNPDDTVLDPQIVLKKTWLSYFCECFRFSRVLSRNSPPILPAQSAVFQDKVTLVLDLDETLVHSTFQPVDCDITLNVTIDKKNTKVYVKKRPGLDLFLSTVSDLFEVVIFTASLEGYARPLLQILDPENKIAHILYRESCTLIQTGYVKDLSRLGRSLNKIIIIDNSPHSYIMHKMNAIPINTWTEDPSDTELGSLIGILRKLAIVNNIPRVLTELKKRNMEITAASLQNVIQNESVLTRGYYNSPVHVKSKRFYFEDT